MTEASPVELLGLPMGELQEVLGPFVDRPFRIRQIYEGLYRQGARDLASVRGLPRGLAEELEHRFVVRWPEIELRESSPDGTEKIVYRLADDSRIETVDIPEARRRTFCVSSQVGCALGCRFCVTGYWGAGRDLTAGEIVAQILERTGPLGSAKPRVNVVFMGMGEPLLNPEEVRRAVAVLLGEISWRRVTVSTAGVVPAIQQMGRWERRPQLAISLHAPDDDRRSEIMPINRKHPLGELMETLREFPLVSGERITFEYLMLDEFNDAPSDAEDLARRLAGLRAKVNLIPLNPDPVLDPGLRPSSPERVEAFRERLSQKGVPCTVRRQRGARVQAACGQLRVPGRDPRGFRGKRASPDLQIAERLRPADEPSRR